MAYLTARKVGEQLDLTHVEVIRRLRRGDIEGKKWGWNWAISSEEVELVKRKPWYQRVMKLRKVRANQEAPA